MTDIVYLACPYTDPDIALRIERFRASARAAAYLIHQGMFVYSPITMTHPIDLVMTSEGETMGSDYWCDFDEAFMRVCSEMVILTIPGWKGSRGIRREIEFFRSHNKPVKLMHQDSQGTYSVAEFLQEEHD